MQSSCHKFTMSQCVSTRNRKKIAEGYAPNVSKCRKKIKKEVGERNN